MSQAPQGKQSALSGPKVVLAIFASIIIITILAVGAFFLTDDPSVKCVEGTLQDNQVGPDGEYLPRTESFTTMAEAESFVCRSIPRPRDTADAVLTEVSVTRTTNLGKLIEKEGGAIVDQQYASPDGGTAFGLQVVFPSPLWPDLPAGDETVKIRGHTAQVQHDAGKSTFTWSEGEFFYTASSTMDPDAFLAVLQSVR
jgi:hypothetical protein